MKKPTPKIPAGKVQAYAETNDLPPARNLTRETSSPAPEVETAEWLAEQGWKRLTFVFESKCEAPGDYRENEILADPDGGLWLVTDWHGKSGIPHRAERRRITREAACARIARSVIPDEFHRDFRECGPSKLRLETAIQEARAFLLLMSDSEGGSRFGSFTGEKGNALQAGITSLSHRIGDELVTAFYAMEETA